VVKIQEGKQSQLYGETTRTCHMGESTTAAGPLAHQRVGGPAGVRLRIDSVVGRQGQTMLAGPGLEGHSANSRR
jgi:hypothetical protein